MNVILSDLLEQVVMVLAGLALTAIGTLGSYYITKLVGNLKEEQLLGKVSRYVRWAEQSPAFKELTGGDKFELVFAKAFQWAENNGIPVDEDELMVAIEDAVSKMKEAAEPLYTGE